MKNICIKFLFVAALSWISTTVVAGPFYVVIASFKQEMRAWKFAEAVKDVFPDAAVTFDAEQNLHHVFAKEMNRREEADNFKSQARRIGFAEAWILTDVQSLQRETYDEDQTSGSVIALELYTGSTVLLGTTDNAFLSIARNKGEAAGIAEVESGSAFIFLAKTSSGKVVPATVSLLDEGGKTLSAFRTNEVVGFKGTRSLMFVCHAPGYSPEAKMVALTHPGNTTDIFQNKEGVWELTFELSPQRANEITLRYGELFHTDAAILQEFARPALDALTKLLQANPEWRIVITTHCSRGNKRTLFLPGAESYFDLSRARSAQGSDKDLRHERARTLHGYLVGSGVDGKRIGVMQSSQGNKGTDANPFAERVELALVTAF